jgi:hypothetical protein
MKSSQSSLSKDAKLTATVRELAEACPMGEAESSCVLKDVRTKSATERERWVEGLTTQEKQRIVAVHEECSSSRKAAVFAKS